MLLAGLHMCVLCMYCISECVCVSCLRYVSCVCVYAHAVDVHPTLHVLCLVNTSLSYGELSH